MSKALSILFVGFVFTLNLYSNSIDPKLEKAYKYLSINTDSAIYLANDVLNEARENNDLQLKANTYIVLAKATLVKGEYLSSLEYFNLISVLLQELNDPGIEADLNRLYGMFNLRIQKYDKAAEYGIKALEYYKETNDQHKLAETYTFFGGLYIATGNLEKTIEYAKKSLAINEKLGLKDKLASNYSNLGVCYSNLQQYDTAQVLIQKAIDINKATNNRQWLAINYHGLGNVFKTQKDTIQAIKAYNTSIDIYKSIGDIVGELSILNLMANLDLKSGKLEDANSKFQYSLEKASEKNLREQKLRALNGLHNISEQQQQFKKALEYLHQYTQLKDEQDEEQSSSFLSIIELQKDFENKRKELARENEEIKLNSEKKNWYIILLLSALTLLTLFVLLIINWNKLKHKSMQMEKEQLNKEVLLKNKELTLSVITQAKKNEERLKIAKKLQEIQKEISFAHRPKLATVIKELKSGKDDKVWEEFEIRFKNVHQDFYQKLKAIGPDLTPAEIKICAFLKLNMSTKEIASILYKSQSTIEVDRARIRKKLGLTNSKVNLVNYLIEL